MKKLLLFAFMAFISTSLFSQKIEKNEIDDFTGEKVVYTSWEKIKQGKGTSGENNLLFMFRHENGTNYLHIKWITAEILSVLDDAKIMFKMSDDSMTTLNSISSVIASRGGGVNGLTWSAAIGLEAIYKGDEMSNFAKETFPVKVRIYSTKGYVDIDIKEKDAQKINKTYQLLANALDK